MHIFVPQPTFSIGFYSTSYSNQYLHLVNIYKLRDQQNLLYFEGFHQYNCQRFLSNHSQECLLNIWRSVGCIANGTMSPANLTPLQLVMYQIELT